jgi:hypothetical protein
LVARGFFGWLAFVPSFDLGLSGWGGILSMRFASSSRRRAISSSLKLDSSHGDLAMIEPFYDLGMTDDQLKTIGMISLNWSIVEREITEILLSFYSFTNWQDGVELVAVLDFDKKLSLCKTKIDRDPKPSGYANADWNKASQTLEHLRKSAEKFRPGRNQVIHGTVVRFFGNVRDPVLRSNKKRVTIELTELPKILEQSSYLTHAMAHMAGALYGWGHQEPLPDIPE